MPYVGNSPAANFASVTKDAFSGDGSTTAFTLSKAATTNGVAVFVENVRQEPTTAYVVSGTTLTFTAAPVSASGNNIYVLHHNAPASTATHPSAQALTATSGTFSSATVTGDLTVGGVDFFVDTSADKIGIGTSTANQLHQKVTIYSSAESGIQFQNDATGVANSTDGARISVFEDDIQYTNYESSGKQIFNVGGGSVKAMEIDASGHVTMPKQSAFSAYTSAAISNIVQGGTETTLLFQTERFDLNADYNTSNSTFTAPVTGKYQFNVSVRLDDQPSNTNYNYTKFKTSNFGYTFWLSAPEDWNGGAFYTATGSVLADLDAGDTCTITYIGQGGSNETDLGDGIFSGYLVA